MEPQHTSGRCAGPSTSLVFQYSCSNVSSQRVRIESWSGTTTFILRVQSSNRCWDIPYSSFNYIQVDTYNCTGTGNQRWIFQGFYTP